MIPGDLRGGMRQFVRSSAARRALVALALMAAVCLSSAAAAEKPKPAAAAQPALPDWKAVEEAAGRYFGSLKDHRAGDLISQTDFDGVLAQLKEINWTPADADEIRAKVPGDRSLLVTEFAKPAGKRFMRQIAKLPMAYDRVEHLASIPNGAQTVRRLIAGPDGYKMIEYLTTAPGGGELGRMLTQVPGGKNFNGPTGRIYTAEALTARLKQSYDTQAAQAAKGPKKR